jgi:hypothetical protein
VGGVLSLPQLLHRMSTAPCAAFHLTGGTLAAGAPADISVLDIGARWRVDPSVFHSKSRNSPFAGRELTGRATFDDRRRQNRSRRHGCLTPIGARAGAQPCGRITLTEERSAVSRETFAAAKFIFQSDA